MAEKKPPKKLPIRRKKKDASRPASHGQKSVMLCSLGLFFLVACAVVAIFDVPGVRTGATPNFVFGVGVVVCVICSLMSGYMSIKQLSVLVEFIKAMFPRVELTR